MRNSQDRKELVNTRKESEEDLGLGGTLVKGQQGLFIQASWPWIP